MKKTPLILLIIISLLLVSSLGISAQEIKLITPGITPDSPLYFLERIFEEIGTFLTFGKVAKAERYANLANERIAEAKAMADKGKPELVEKTLVIYQDQREKSLIKLKEARVKGEETTEVEQLIAKTTPRHLEVLKDIYHKVPTETKEVIKSTIIISGKEQEQVVELLRQKGDLEEIPEDASISGESVKGEECTDLLGDVNHNGKLDKQDADWILEMYVGSRDVDPCGDVSQNGEVTPYDASLVLRFIEGPKCGNDLIEPGEICDSTNLGGETCITQGFDFGTLTCSRDCKSFDTSGCYREDFGENKKDISKYSNKEVFLISSKDWKKVLSFLPISIWTSAGEIKKYPYLIVHEEGEIVDPDSTVRFIDAYNPDRITLVGDFTSDFENLMASRYRRIINKVLLKNRLLYWKSYKIVIYSADDYQTTLLASTLASFKNAPLIIKGNENIAGLRFNDKEVFALGGVECPVKVKSCTKLKTIEEIQTKINEIIKTDKIILVNTDDLDYYYTESDDEQKPIEDYSSPPENYPSYLVSELTGKRINRMFYKDSLIAPILAASKHELILFSPSSSTDAISKNLKTDIQKLKINPNYLTIIGNPFVIPQAVSDGKSAFGQGYREVDNSVYGDLDGDFIPDVAVGRIYGITVSDTSSVIARSIFYDMLNPPKKSSFLWAPDFIEMLAETYILDSWTKKIGFLSKLNIIGNLDCASESECKSKRFDLKSALEEFSIIVYQSHGSPVGGGHGLDTRTLNLEKISLDSPIFLTLACATCSFDRATVKSELFCLNILRRGGVAYFGAVEDFSATGVSIARNSISLIYSGKSLGKAIKEFKTILGYRSKNQGHQYINDAFFILLGDPTLVILGNNYEKLGFQDKISHDPLTKTITITLPAITDRNKFSYGFYGVLQPGKYHEGNAYYDDKTSNIATTKFLLEKGRSSFQYTFFLPIININSITDFKIEYANGQDFISEGVFFSEDNKGKTWFTFEEVLYDIGKTNGVPNRVVTINYD